MRSPLLLSLLAAAVAACGSSPAPATPAPAIRPAARPATTAAISPSDLERRMHIFAHDSMLGREAGTLGNVKGTAYLAAELARLGLEPAGDDGTFFQAVPLITRSADTTRLLVAGGDTLRFRRDWVPVPPFGGFFPFGVRGSLDGAQAVFGGRLGSADLLDPAAAEDKLVVFLPPLVAGNRINFQFWINDGVTTLASYAGARGIAVASLDASPAQVAAIFTEPQEDLAAGSVHADVAPLGLVISDRAARALLGIAPDQAAVGAVGATMAGTPAFTETAPPHPARNVVGIVRGRDPARRGTYVAIGAHNDHIGLVEQPVEHDSLRAFNRVVRPGGAEDRSRRPSAEEAGRIRAILDSLRLVRPPRQDSVRNGADDDGSGSVALLEMAEAFVAGAPPARSLLFVWHTAEEKGLLGAYYFTEHPTVPRDSIVAQLNIDMIGRNAPDYLQLIGSRRLSTELGDLVEAVNREGNFGFTFDYQFDADGHPANYYCRSDHYMYARFGIPVVFFTSGSHPDYHMLTDEPQYIAYDKLARVTRFVAAVAERVAEMPARPVVDQPKPDPYGTCQQ